MELDVDVIVVGGGPVGSALGIELGLQGVATLVLEKHEAPQQLPKAQLLNPRTMEFFRRWGIRERLLGRKLLPESFPLNVIWCSGLNGELYGKVNPTVHLSSSISPELYQRIPLWITEGILRERLKELPSVTWKERSPVVKVCQHADWVEVAVQEKDGYRIWKSRYVVAADGANSLIRQQAGIAFSEESPSQKMLNLLFYAPEIGERMTLSEGILYYNLSLSTPAALGVVDPATGLWYAQMACKNDMDLDNIDAAALLDEAVGFPFQKKIVQKMFWNMQARIAESYRNKRIFLAGDSAHMFPPTGGHGLNTGFGDAVNLAWKLAQVVYGQDSEELLDSYEAERRPVALFNLAVSRKNMLDARAIKERFLLENDRKEFARANAQLAQQHVNSLGVAMGYRYRLADTIQAYELQKADIYDPQAEPGFFAPHLILEDGACLYDRLLPQWSLLAFEEISAATIEKLPSRIGYLSLPKESGKGLYSKPYYLLRPDWHIAWCGDNLDLLKD